MKSTHVILVIFGSFLAAACSDPPRTRAERVTTDVTNTPCGPEDLPAGFTDGTVYCNVKAHCAATDDGFDCSGLDGTVTFFRCDDIGAEGTSNFVCRPCSCQSDAECAYHGESDITSTCEEGCTEGCDNMCEHTRPKDGAPDAASVDAGSDAAIGSCVDWCGGSSDDGCMCDPECKAYGDCCPDYDEACPEADASDMDAADAGTDAGMDAGLPGVDAVTSADAAGDGGGLDAMPSPSPTPSPTPTPTPIPSPIPKRTP